MNLQHPEFLWALLALPLLWWLSRPPKPSKQLWTAHLPQWQLAMRALRRRPPRGSLLRFLLLALALAAASLAAAGPTLPGEPGPDRLVVLLDGSRSMAAEHDGEAAFARARQALTSRLAAVPEHVDVTLLRCGGDLRRRYGEAARQLADLGVPAGPLDVDLGELADSLQDERTAVWTLTDGQAQVRVPKTGALDVFDARGPNAAIVAVRVQDAWPLPSLQVAVDLVVHADEGVEVGLFARGAIDGGEERRVVDWRDSIATTVRLDLRRDAAGGELELRVALAGDVLSQDDARVVRLPPLPAPRIAVLADAEAGPFAAVAAKALADEVGGRVVPPTAGGEVGLLLVDGGAAEVEAGQVRAMTFGTRLADGPAEPEVWSAPAAIDWAREHALTRGLDLSELRVERAWRGLLPDGEPLLWSDEGAQRTPLAVLVQGEGVASIHFAFRLQDGNLPLLAAFPQLLRRGFVRSYGDAATLVVEGDEPPAGELELRYAQPPQSRPLPRFGTAERSLARWCIVAGLLALGLRAFVR
jgi:hypothetical protein